METCHRQKPKLSYQSATKASLSWKFAAQPNIGSIDCTIVA